MNDYIDITNIEYSGINNIYNPYPDTYINYNDYSGSECIIDNRCLISGIDSLYDEEYYDYLKDYFSYMEYNEVYDY